MFLKEMSKVSQLEEGKGAEKRGIISRTGEKPPAAAEIRDGAIGCFHRERDMTWVKEERRF